MNALPSAWWLFLPFIVGAVLIVALYVLCAPKADPVQETEPDASDLAEIEAMLRKASKESA